MMNSMIHGRRGWTMVGFLVLITLILAACMPVQPEAVAAASPDEEDIEAVAQGVWDRYAGTVNAGDFESWLDIWTDDGARLAANMPPSYGKEEISEVIEGDFSLFDLDMTIDMQEAVSSGDLAYSWGFFDFTLTPKAGGDPIVLDGKFMSILQKQPDGTWKLHRDAVMINAPPAPAAMDMEAVTAEIDTLFAEYGASLGAGDAERWIQLWTEDGVQLPPGAPPNVGREAIFASLSAALELFAFEDMEIDIEEVLVAGDLAIARGMYRVTYVPHDGSDPIPVDGKYTSTFQRQPDGSWKLYRDIFNSNVPPE